MTEEPMFVWYKGRGRSQLQPASTRGWLIFLGFMGALMAPLPLLIWAAVATDTPWLAMLQFAWAAPVLLFFFRFAAARAKVIDLDEVTRDWDDFRAWRKKDKRR